MNRREKVRVATGAWCLAFFGTICLSFLVAWLADAWETHRQGAGIGFMAVAIVFWGGVLGASVIGPAAAGIAITRADGRRTAADPARRRIAIVTGLCVVAALLVAGGGVAACLAEWTPCRGIPPHTSIGRGSFQYVLPSPDRSRFVWVGYSDAIGLLDPAAPVFEDPDAFRLPRRTTLLSAAWMPDSRRLLLAFRTGREYAIGIISSDTGQLESSRPLRFRLAERDGIAVSPDGSSALVLAAGTQDAFGKRLYQVDLASGKSDLVARFDYGATSPLYLDARSAVVIEADLGHAALTLVDLRTGALRQLTANDVSVFQLAGPDARGDLVFTGFHVTPDRNVTTEDQDDPFVGEANVANGQIHELFEPGVTRAMRMIATSTDAVVLAQTCSGDCVGEQIWKLDLSRYVASDAQ